MPFGVMAIGAGNPGIIIPLVWTGAGTPFVVPAWLAVVVPLVVLLEQQLLTFAGAAGASIIGLVFAVDVCEAVDVFEPPPPPPPQQLPVEAPLAGTEPLTTTGCVGASPLVFDPIIGDAKGCGNMGYIIG